VRHAINFDDQLSVKCHEVDDVSIDRVLAPKFPARQLPIAERLP
jgi:hypothetical protein